jgi:hypothetical protein
MSLVYRDKWEGGRKIKGDINFNIPAYISKTSPISSIPSLPIALGKLNNLTYFYASLIPLPSPPRPNYTLKFEVFDDIEPLLIKSPSPFVYDL